MTTDTNVDISVGDIDDALLDDLLDLTPSVTPSANDLKGATKPVPPKADKTDPKDESKDDSGSKDVTPEELDDILDEVLDSDTTDTTTPKASKTTNDSNLFKSKAQSLIDKGVWQPFEGMEEYEWDDESYAKVAEIQAGWKAEEIYNNKLEEVGDIGKAILEHVENGGNPDDIISIFKEAKKVEAFDINTPTGQEEIVKEYYKNVVGWNEGKVTRFIKTLIDEGTLKDEATEAKSLIDESIQERVQEVQEQQKIAKQQQYEAQVAWESTITETIKSRKDISDKEKKDVQKALLVYDQKLPDGRQVNEFMVNFLKMQSDPEKYIDLVLYVRNPEKYKENIAKKTSTETTKKNWDFIKGNNAVNKNTGAQGHTRIQPKEKDDFKINYKDFIK